MAFNDQEGFPLIASKIKGLIPCKKLQFRVYAGIITCFGTLDGDISV
jgi:hypothetical protein